MKFKIEVNEVRSFSHEFIVEAENENKLNSILNSIESEKMLGLGDYIHLLDNECNIIELIEDSDGDLGEIKCTDIQEYDENEAQDEL